MTAWVGGSNLGSQSMRAPLDVLCYRPEDFKSMQKQHESLKAGLEPPKRLELPSGNNKGIALTTWIQEVKLMIETKGFDTVFRVFDPKKNVEVYLLERWGEVTPEQIESWVALLRTSFGDRWDKENLRLSAMAMRESLGPELYARVSSLCNADTTGPEYFKKAVDQISYMNSTMVRNLSNKLGNLKLKEIDGENVAKLTEKITEIAREIQGSGCPPADLHNLISKPYTTGTEETFRTYALGIHGKVMTGEYMRSWEQMVQSYNLFYQELLQADDYPPAKGSKDQDDAIHGLIAKAIDRKLEMMKPQAGNNSDPSQQKGKRTCFECGSEEHLVRDCPRKKNGAERNWRVVPPNTSRGDSKEKIIDGITYKWCGKCRSGKGFWNGGDKAHFTHEHRGNQSSNNENSNNESNDGEVRANVQANVGYVDEPLTFGFLGYISNDEQLDGDLDDAKDPEHPKEWRGRW